MNLSDAVHVLSILAQEHRLAIFRQLVQAGPGGLVAGQIAEIVGIPPATLSFHLKTLAYGALVRRTQEGRFVRYTANFEAMHQLIDYLSENCCGGNAASCSPDALRSATHAAMPPTLSNPIPCSSDTCMSTTPPKTVLVLCTGNSCRSQMAEVLINHDLAGAARALSAGARPQPKVADGAIAALQDAGLNTEGLHPKDIDAVMDETIDLVVTVCDNAKEACPVFPGAVKSIHLPFHDPHGEPLQSFIQVRDDIRARLIPVVREQLGL